MEKKRPYTKEWLEELCKNSYTFTDVLIKAGRSPKSGGNKVLLR